MSTTAQMNFTLDVAQAITDALGNVPFSPQIKKQLTFGAGVGAGLIDRGYVKEITLVAATANNFDLNGSNVDVLGQPAVFAKVRGLFILADNTNTTAVEVGGHATAAFLGPFKDATDVLTVQPGELLTLTSWTIGWPVTATTADILKLLSSATAKIKIAILGTSA